MYTTYHLASAQEVNNDILDSIKATFKSKAITIIVEEVDDFSELDPSVKKTLDERLLEDQRDDLSSEDSILQLKKKYTV
jgi:hypothetical protein